MDKQSRTNTNTSGQPWIPADDHAQARTMTGADNDGRARMITDTSVQLVLVRIGNTDEFGQLRTRADNYLMITDT